jgi:hypothetical protein
VPPPSASGRDEPYDYSEDEIKIGASHGGTLAHRNIKIDL